jgi:hypothetical protein
MNKPVAHESSPVTLQVKRAGAKYVGKIGSALCVALGRLYAAHVEKAQMRLAPTRTGPLQCLAAGRHRRADRCH